MFLASNIEKENITLVRILCNPLIGGKFIDKKKKYKKKAPISNDAFLGNEARFVLTSQTSLYHCAIRYRG